MENPRSEEALAESAARNWSKYWDKRSAELSPQIQRGFPSKFKRFFLYTGALELAFRILKREMKNPQGKRILEAGCGMGEISLRLAHRGNVLIMMDTSLSALQYVRARAEALGIPVFILQASIFRLPFKSGIFDFAFNVGVLDHFGLEYRQKGVKQMVEVVKSRGRAVILTNSYKSFIHPFAMRAAQKKGLWHFGFKDSVRTLQYSKDANSEDFTIKEYSRGFISQFEFLHYCIPEVKLFKWLFFRFFYLFTWPFGFLNRLSGQYLVSVLEKK